MPFTRPLEVYVHPLHAPLSPRQLERRELFSHHFGSTLPYPFIPKWGKPSREPPPTPFWFPSPYHVVSTRYPFFSESTPFSGHIPDSRARRHSPLSGSASPVSSQSRVLSNEDMSSASNSLVSSSRRSSDASPLPVDYSSLRVQPGYSYADAAATYSSPPGQRLRLHYLSSSEGAARCCRNQIRNEGLRFNSTGNRLLVAAKEHVVVLDATAITTECCISCPGATIVLPHNTHPDLFAVAGQEVYQQQSPYVRLYDIRTALSKSSSGTTRSSSSSVGGREESTPVMELWGHRQDGWWSACWSPVGEKVVCVDRADVLHVFSLKGGRRKAAAAAAAARAVPASDSKSPGRTAGTFVSTSGSSTAATAGGKGSTFSTGTTSSKRHTHNASSAEVTDGGSVTAHDGSSASEKGRPKTPFTSTPGGIGTRGSGTGATAEKRSSPGGNSGGNPGSASTSCAPGLSSANIKRSSVSSSPEGGPSTPGTGVSRTPSPHNNSSLKTPRSHFPVYVHQLEGIVNACTFHPCGEFLLLAQDDGRLLILPFDAASSTDPLLTAAESPKSGRATCTAADSINSSSYSLSLSLPLHQGGVTCCAADPSGRFVATGGSTSERCVLLLDAESMEVVGEIGRTEGGLQALSFSFDGQFLAWGCRDATAPPSNLTGASSGRGYGADGGSYGGGRTESSSEEKQETMLTIAGTNPCEIYLQCPTPAAVSAVAFHPMRYICAFATEADTSVAAQQQQSRQGMGSTTFWSKSQHSQQPYSLGFLSFE